MISLMTLIGFLTLSAFMSFLLAYLEGKRNNFRLFSSVHLPGVIGSVLSVGLTISLWYYFEASDQSFNNVLLYSLISSRVLFALLSAKVATDKRRNLFGWFLVTLIEPTFSLLAISTVPGLIKSSNMFSREIKFINQKYIENLQTIRKLREAELLSKADFEKKQADLKLKYEMQLHLILANQQEKMMKIEKKNLLHKLEVAYSSGVLTKEEYLAKKEQLQRTDESEALESPTLSK